MVDAKLQIFIQEAFKRGFSERTIRRALIAEGWSLDEVNHAFETYGEKQKRNQVCVYLDDQVLGVIEKRATRNMMSVAEQVEDIVRRSAVNAKGASPKPEKLDDLLVALFSRRTKKR